MKKRFSASNTPLLAGVVKERTPEDAIKKIRYFEENGARGKRLSNRAFHHG